MISPPDKPIRFSGSKQAKQKRLVAFSFDDGPEKRILPLLDTLEERNIKATFFWMVDKATRLSKEDHGLFNEILTRLKESGHEIGLHTPYDYKASLISRFIGKFSEKDMEEAKRNLEEVTGFNINLYRPHYFHVGPYLFYIRNLGMTIVLGDFLHSAQADAPVKTQVRKFSGAVPGSILIFHDGISLSREHTHVLEVLPQVIDNLKNKGLMPVSISEVFKD